MTAITGEEKLTDPQTRDAGIDRMMAALVALNVALTILMVFVTCFHPNGGTDYFWLQTTGALILKTHHVPTVDPFSWTAQGQRWFVQEWFTAVLFRWMTTHAPQALVLYKCGLGALIGALVLCRARIRSGSWIVSILVTLMAGIVFRNWADVRAQMFTYTFLAAILLGLDLYRRGRAPALPYLLPILFMVWANVHAGSIIGFGLTIVWIAGEAALGRVLKEHRTPLRPLILGMFASALAIGVNPNGFALYAYPVWALSDTRMMSEIADWVSPDFHKPMFVMFEALLLTTPAAMALAGRGRSWSAGDGLLLLVLTHSALFSMRNVPLFAIAAAPLLAGAAVEACKKISLPDRLLSSLRSPAMRTAGAAGLAALLLCGIWKQRPQAHASNLVAVSLKTATFPRDGATFLLTHCPGRLFNEYNWGGYLIARLYPKRLVFVDQRSEVFFKCGAYDDHLPIQMAQPGWQTKLDRWQVQTVITFRHGPLAEALRKETGWSEAFDGPIEAVFARTPPRSASTQGSRQRSTVQAQ